MTSRPRSPRWTVLPRRLPRDLPVERHRPLQHALDGASPPTPVTVGVHSGKKVELSTPADLDPVTECDRDGGGSDGIFGRFVYDRGFSAHPYTHGMGQHQTIYILDVDGTRQVIDAMYLPSASAADRAEQDQIVASIRFESQAPSPSPSP